MGWQIHRLSYHRLQAAAAKANTASVTACLTCCANTTCIANTDKTVDQMDRQRQHTSVDQLHRQCQHRSVDQIDRQCQHMNVDQRDRQCQQDGSDELLLTWRQPPCMRLTVITEAHLLTSTGTPLCKTPKADQAADAQQRQSKSATGGEHIPKSEVAKASR